MQALKQADEKLESRYHLNPVNYIIPGYDIRQIIQEPVGLLLDAYGLPVSISCLSAS